jgi:hypothetical protein
MGIDRSANKRVHGMRTGGRAGGFLYCLRYVTTDERMHSLNSVLTCMLRHELLAPLTAAMV